MTSFGGGASKSSSFLGRLFGASSDDDIKLEPRIGS
jgi:hypothetical protein